MLRTYRPGHQYLNPTRTPTTAGSPRWAMSMSARKKLRVVSYFVFVML